jgi:hypothetical protein
VAAAITPGWRPARSHATSASPSGRPWSAGTGRGARHATTLLGLSLGERHAAAAGQPRREPTGVSASHAPWDPLGGPEVDPPHGWPVHCGPSPARPSRPPIGRVRNTTPAARARPGHPGPAAPESRVPGRGSGRRWAGPLKPARRRGLGAVPPRWQRPGPRGWAASTQPERESRGRPRRLGGRGRGGVRASVLPTRAASVSDAWPAWFEWPPRFAADRSALLRRGTAGGPSSAGKPRRAPVDRWGKFHGGRTLRRGEARRRRSWTAEAAGRKTPRASRARGPGPTTPRIRTSGSRWPRGRASLGKGAGGIRGTSTSRPTPPTRPGRRTPGHPAARPQHLGGTVRASMTSAANPVGGERGQRRRGSPRATGPGAGPHVASGGHQIHAGGLGRDGPA